MYMPEEAANAPSGFSNWRAYTIILYLNDTWQPADGGCLRMYDGGGVAPPPVTRPHDTVPRSALWAEQRHTDIEPLSGRVVAFNSLLHHEVMPAYRPRFACTLWIWKEDTRPMGGAGLHAGGAANDTQRPPPPPPPSG